MWVLERVMSIDKEREAFEAEAINFRIGEGVISLSQHDNGEYISAITRIAFEAWQARAKQHSGEAVAYMDTAGNLVKYCHLNSMRARGEELTPLFLSPQQPQSVADALEQAARHLEAFANDCYYVNPTADDLRFVADEIRNLINQPTQKG
jgi:hypothetical protein